MGIPHYFLYASRKYPNILSTLETALVRSGRITHLYLDCNSLVYDAIHTIIPQFGERGYVAQIIRKIIHKIEMYVAYIQPTERVFIAFDGVAPRAKMDHQRSTRIHSMFIDTAAEMVDEAAITPGTSFMNTLTHTIREHFASMKLYTVSAADEPGEGEQKIFAHLRSSIQPHHTAAIYGLDADLLMLSLAHIHRCNNILVVREKPPNVVIAGQLDIPAGTLCATDISVFAHSIDTEMAARCLHPRMLSQKGISSLIYDYIVLCFFLGNDFLPQLPSLNIHTGAISVLLNVYAESIGTRANAAFVRDGQLQWPAISVFLSALAEKEPAMLAAEITVRNNMAQALRARITSGNIKEEDAYATSFPLLHREAEENIRPGTGRWKSRYYTAVFGDRITRAELAPRVARAYFKTLQWVFHYYTSGTTCWMLTYGFIGAPLITDLGQYCPRSVISRDIGMCDTVSRPMSPMAQLVYVLPRTMHHLLPPALRKLLAHPKYAYLYPTHPIFRGAFCQWTKSAQAELPPIPDELLHI